MSVSAIVPEKSRENKKCDQEKETERQNFGLFDIGLKYSWHGCLQLFDIYMFTLLRTAR